MEMSNDFDRLLFFEHARTSAEASYAKNPLDADVRTRPSIIYIYILTLICFRMRALLFIFREVLLIGDVLGYEILLFFC